MFYLVYVFSLTSRLFGTIRTNNSFTVVALIKGFTWSDLSVTILAHEAFLCSRDTNKKNFLINIFCAQLNIHHKKSYLMVIFLLKNKIRLRGCNLLLTLGALFAFFLCKTRYAKWPLVLITVNALSNQLLGTKSAHKTVIMVYRRIGQNS